MRDESSVQLNEDVGLMVRTRDGDHSAYERIYGQYFAIVVAFLERHHAPDHMCEDLAQEVFVRVWSRRGQYRPLGSVKGYLLGVAANVLRESRARDHAWISTDLEDFESAEDATGPLPSSRAEAAEQIQAIRDLMATLPAAQRQALELVYLVGLDPEEAARRLDCSLKALRVHLCAARQTLRRLARPSQ